MGNLNEILFICNAIPVYKKSLEKRELYSPKTDAKLPGVRVRSKHCLEKMKIELLGVGLVLKLTVGDT